jgi:hypothetical protein
MKTAQVTAREIQRMPMPQVRHQGSETALRDLGITLQAKLAFTFADIERTFRRSKALVKKLPTTTTYGLFGPGALPSTLLPQINAQYAKMLQDASTHLPQMMPEVAARQRDAHRLIGSIIMPKNTGGVTGYLRENGIRSADHLHGPARKTLEGVMHAHELDELALGRNTLKHPTFRGAVGHASPDVLLREHNRLTTLPQSVRTPVQRVFKELRQGPEQGLFHNATRNQYHTGMQFGEGMRLSRHARRRIGQKMQANLDRGEIWETT